MDIKKAARETLKAACIGNVPIDEYQYGYDHIRMMLTKIAEGEITGEKAHRWLGWAQCAVCINCGVPLEELKLINHAS